jgi:hypothetical protein
VRDLRLAAVRQVLGAVNRGQARRVPEAPRRLHAELDLERAQLRGGVESPVTPVEPVRQSWKNMPMIANMARRPFAIGPEAVST